MLGAAGCGKAGKQQQEKELHALRVEGYKVLISLWAFEKVYTSGYLQLYADFIDGFYLPQVYEPFAKSISYIFKIILRYKPQRVKKGTEKSCTASYIRKRYAQLFQNPMLLNAIIF